MLMNTPGYKESDSAAVELLRSRVESLFMRADILEGWLKRRLKARV